MSPGRRRAIRALASIALLAAVVAVLPAGTLQSALAEASVTMIALSVASFIVCHLVAAFKWRMLMGPSVELSYPKAVTAHFTGLVGNLTPLGMIGGDLLRAAVASNGSVRPAAIVLSSVVDRIVDSLALVLLALAGFTWVGGRSIAAWVLFSGGIVVSAFGIAALLLGQRVLQRSGNARLTGIRDAFGMLVERPGLIARALVLSVFVQGSLVTINAYIGMSVGVESSFGAWLLAWPATKFAAYLPVGIAGIGVREAALVALLRPLGGAPGPVMAAGLLWDAVIVIGALAGWLLFTWLPALRHVALRRIALRRIQTP